MCHQSVGLIARTIEADLGLPTVTLSSAWSITAAANPPRSAFVDYPLGNTAGQPHDSADQIRIVSAALGLLETATASGAITTLDGVWPTPWKSEARILRDSRNERHNTPQYQSNDDRDAAIERHGDAAACEVCAVGTIPVD